jgi:hypothetical protein
VCKLIWTGNWTEHNRTAAAHELFHSIQYADQQVFSDWRNGKSEDWVIEGSAAAVEHSWDQMRLQRSPDYGAELRFVDLAMSDKHQSDDLQQYRAQEFWVYYSQEYAQNLSFFKDIFPEGATSNAVESGLPDDAPLKEVYWGWVKNQVFEKKIDFDGILTDECVFQEDAVDDLETYEYPENSPGETYPVTDLKPLETKVIEVEFGFPLPGSAAITETLSTSGDDPWLRVKLYENDDPWCDLRGDLHEDTPFSTDEFNTEPDGRYFIVVSNTHHSETYSFEIQIEGGYSPGDP